MGPRTVYYQFADSRTSSVPTIAAGTNQYAFTINLDEANAPGAGGADCAGCNAPMTVLWRSLDIVSTTEPLVHVGPCDGSIRSAIATANGGATIQPVITGFTPGSGSPGTQVRIRGSRLAAATQVLFNSVSAPINETSLTDTAITVTVPAGAVAGPITVEALCGAASVTSHDFFCVSTGVSADANCNGIDDNCDGIVDNGVSGCTCIENGPGLAGWWRGNGTSNDAAAGNNGALQGGAGYAAGRVGQAFSLNGTTAYVANLGDAYSYAFIENTGVFTIDAWINTDVTVHMQQAITASTGTSTEKGHFFIWENSSGEQKLRLGLMKAIDSAPVIESSSPNQVITTNGWHHVAAVGNGATVTFYVDGVGYPGTGTMSSKPNGPSTRAVDIGRCPAATAQCMFSGLIDEVQIYDRAMSPPAIRAIYNTGGNGMCGTGCAQTIPDLVGWWPGSGDGGDRSPAGNNGALHGSVGFATGKVGQAFSFPGSTTAYVGLPNSDAMQFTSHFTLMAWIHPNDVSNYQQIISKWSLTAGDFGYQMNVAAGGALRLDVSDDGSHYGNVISPGGVLTGGTWSHVAATFDAGTCRLYVNGSLVKSQSTVTSAHQTTTVGPYLGVGNGDVQRFGGLIDEPMAFSRALSGAEIRAIYQAGSSGMCGLGLVNGVDEPSPLTRSLTMEVPSPNPSVRMVHVRFNLPAAAVVRAEVFDVVGRRIATLVDGERMPAGEQQLTWDRRDDTGQRVRPGMYQVRVTAGGAVATRKIVMIEP